MYTMCLRFVVQLNSRQNFYITPQREYLPQDGYLFLFGYLTNC